jgi:acyl carrier protein
MHEFGELQVRHLVADHLGVGLQDLVSGVSLRDDLAADSLDLFELAMILEGEFTIVMPERILDEVRTYSDLVHATGLLIRARCEAKASGAEPPQCDWATADGVAEPPQDARRAPSGRLLDRLGATITGHAGNDPWPAGVRIARGQRGDSSSSSVA